MDRGRWPSGWDRWPTLPSDSESRRRRDNHRRISPAATICPTAGAGPRFNTQTVDAAVRWQVPEDGLYQVLISDLYASQRGHPRLTYRLVIRREQPDFAVVLLPNSPTGADAVTIRAGGRASAYVAAIRRDGFAGPIRVELATCPPASARIPSRSGPGRRSRRSFSKRPRTRRPRWGSHHVAGLSRFGDRQGDPRIPRGRFATGTGPGTHRARRRHDLAAECDCTSGRAGAGREWIRHGRARRAGPAQPDRHAQSSSLSQGRLCYLNVSVNRRAGFVEAVSVTATDLPPNMLAATVPIAKEAKTGLFPFFVGKNLPPGIYTFVLRGTGHYPFNKDPKAKEKPNINLIEPSNPITVLIRPSPVNMTVDNKGGALKQGGSLEVDVNIARQNGCTGAVSLSLVSGPALKLTAAPVSVEAAQTQAKIVIQAAKDSPAGNAIPVVVRAAASVKGEVIEVDEPVGL